MTPAKRTARGTGGAGEIGKALCRKLCGEGVSVALTDLSLERAEEAATLIRQEGGRIRAYEMNVESTESVRSAAEKILADFGRIDILVNNAGVWRPSRFEETSEEKWTKTLNLNLTGTFRVTQAFLKPMLENGYGRIINLGSIAGEVGLPGYCDYAAAKGGVILMTKTLAMELAKKNITVNCVSPGMVGPVRRETKGTWIGRTGSGEEIANLIVFLASDDSSFITGVDYTVDGGRILGPRFCEY